MHRAAPLRLLHRLLHRGGVLVGVHDDATVHVPRGAPHGLDERTAAAEEALLVRIEDGDERHLGEVEPLTEDARERLSELRNDAAAAQLSYEDLLGPA